MKIPGFFPAFLRALWPERVRTQLIFGVALVHLVLMSVFVLDLTGRQRTFLLNQSLEHVKAFAQTLADNSTSWMLANDVAGLSELVAKTRHYHTVRAMMIVDPDGKVLAHTDRSLPGKYLKDDLSRSFLKGEPGIHVLRADPRDLDIAAPILTRNGKCLGWARVIHDREYVAESLRRVSHYGVIYTLLAILTGSLLALLIGNRLTGGLYRLIDFADGIKSGRHDLRVLALPGYEVGKLGEGFNRMLDAMQARGSENAELRHILDNMAEGCLIVGFDWTYHYVNATAALQRFRPREDLVGHKLLEIFPDAEGSRIFAAYRQCLEERTRLHFESEHTFKEGHPGWYELRVEPVPEGIFVLSLDISERKRAEKELAESEKKYRTLVETLNEGIWVIDALARTTFVNPRMAAMLGYTVGEMQGKELFYFMDERGKELALHNIERRKGGITEQHDFEFIRKDGSRIYTILETTPVLDGEGNYAGALAAVADITERKQMQKDLELARTLNIRTEELRQANIKLREVDRLKSMFIATMSHELRTPLNSIIGFSSILLKEWCGPVNDEQKENLATVLAAGRHLHMLINDVIDVSKIEAGKLESIVEEFELRDLVDEALALIKTERGGNGLKFSAVHVGQRMRTDRRRLLQCLINLLSNAAKFTPEGTVSITSAILPGGLAEITVTDTGIGIKEEDLPRLFLPFVRLASPLSDKTRGTGLGLHLVKKIVTEILKGEVFARSVYAKGSSFGFRVPISIEQEK
jgi:PAS domain S-box-containing protein